MTGMDIIDMSQSLKGLEGQVAILVFSNGAQSSAKKSKARLTWYA